jgi:hypothetical protein
MSSEKEMGPGAGKEFLSAITVRLGMAAGGVLGGLAGYWVPAAVAPGREGLWIPAGALAGFAVSLAALAWLARRHRGAGILAGVVLTIAAAVAVVAHVVSRRGG